MPKDDEAIIKLKADVQPLKKAMQDAQRSVKLANAEFKHASAGMEDWSKNADGINAKLTQLNKVQSAQRTQLSLLERELEKNIEAYGENSKEADNLRIKIEYQKAAIVNTDSEIEKYTKALDDCGKETDDLGDEMQETEKQTEQLSDGFTVAKGVLADLVASGIKAAIDGLKDLAKFAKAAYDEFDAGADAVIKATGATGEAAAELTKNYQNLAHEVVGDMGDMGAALGEVNTRFGYTGDELEQTTKDFLQFADITGTDATEAVRLVSRALNNSGMEAKDYSKLLDILAKAGQATGVSVSSLTESVTKNGAQFRQLGFTTEEAVAMLAKFELEGVNSETVLAGMKKAVANWGKEGKNAREEYAKALEEIANTEDIAEASAKAIEVFGTKAGPELVEDIQAGKLEYKDFLDVLKNSQDTVKNTYEETKDGFDEVTLAIQGGKADLGAFVREIATKHKDDIKRVINNVLKWLKDAVTWVFRNGKLIIETIKSIVKVAATLWAVNKASQYAKAINGVITAIKAMKTATEATSAATGILANLVSPGGAIVLGITAVVAVTTTLINAFKEEKKEIDVLTDAEKESIEQSRNLYSAYEEMNKQREENVKATQNEWAHYGDLKQRLDEIVGATGNVKKGYEDEAAFIVDTLNKALDLEIELKDGVITNYQKERQEIEKTISLKQAEAILIANEQAYAEAIKKKTDAAVVYANAQDTFNDVLKRAEEKAVELQECYIELARIEKEEGVAAAEDYTRSHAHLLGEYEALQVEVNKTRGALHDATDAYEGYNTTIKNYEGLSSAIISGDADKINIAMLKSVANMKDSTTTTADVLKDQVDIFNDNYQKLKKAVEDGDKNVTQQMVDDAKKLRDEAGKEYMKSGGTSVAEYARGIKEESVYAEEAAKKLGYDSYEEFNNALYSGETIKTKTSGDNFANGFINAVTGAYKKAYNAAYGLAEQATQGVKDAQDEHSPSKVTARSGANFVRGYMNGINALAPDLLDVVQELIAGAVGELDGESVLDVAKDAANGLVTGLNTPVSFGGLTDVKEAVKEPNLRNIQSDSGAKSVVNNYTFTQNNTSPKALSRLEIYRQTKNQLNFAKGVR